MQDGELLLRMGDFEEDIGGQKKQQRTQVQRESSLLTTYWSKST